MKNKLQKILKSWGTMTVILTASMAILLPLLLILWEMIARFITGNEIVLHEFIRLSAILENMIKGALMGFLLGFGLGSFNLLFLFQKGNDAN